MTTYLPLQIITPNVVTRMLKPRSQIFSNIGGHRNTPPKHNFAYIPDLRSKLPFDAAPSR